MLQRLSCVCLLAAAPVLWGQTHFVRHDYPNPGAGRPVLVDVNNDGRLDLIVPHGVGSPFTNPYGFRTYLANPALPGGFLSPTFTENTTRVDRPHTAIVGDFDNDGRMDVVLRIQNSSFFHKGNGNGTFQPNSAVTLGGSSALAPIVLDFNNDGRLDILLGGPLLRLLGNGDGTFTTSGLVVSSCVEFSSNAVLADLNSDGRADLLTACNGGFAYLQRNADGSWAAPVLRQLLTPDTGARVLVAAGDVNGDGRQDVIYVQSSGFANATAVVVAGNGDGTFQPASTASVLSGAVFGIAVSDFTYDGQLDLVTVSYNVSAGAPLQVWRGQPSGVFVPLGTQDLSGSFGTSPAVTNLPMADLNQDGSVDLIVSLPYGASPPPDSDTAMVNVLLGLPPTVLISVSANPVIVGNPVTLTANVVSRHAGFSYVSGGSIRFFSGNTALGGPIPLNTGQAVLTTNSLTAGVHHLRAVFVPDGSAATVSSQFVSVVVAASQCAPFANLLIRPGGFRLDRITNQFLQDVQITNQSGTPIPGPLSLVVQALSANAALVGPSGQTTCPPAGAPYVDLGVCPNGALNPGQTITTTLRFHNPPRLPITYVPGVAAGLAMR